MSSVLKGLGFGFLLALSSLHAELRVVGTDLLGVEFSKALYEVSARSALTVALAFDGSRPGLDELKAGRADLGLITLPAEEEFNSPAFLSLPVAYHRVVVLAPAKCPLPQLNLPQLAGVFASDAAAFAHWGDVGAGGEWTALAIAPLAPEVGTGVMLEYFRHLVLRDRDVKGNVARYRDAAALLRYFDGDSRVLAIAAAPPADATRAKVIPLAAKPRDPAYLPTPENLHSGDYPLRLPVRLVFRREAARELRPLLRFLVSDEAAPHFTRAGLVPLPAAARAQQLAAVDKM